MDESVFVGASVTRGLNSGVRSDIVNIGSHHISVILLYRVLNRITFGYKTFMMRASDSYNTIFRLVNISM